MIDRIRNPVHRLALPQDVTGKSVRSEENRVVPFERPIAEVEVRTRFAVRAHTAWERREVFPCLQRGPLDETTVPARLSFTTAGRNPVHRQSRPFGERCGDE